MKRKAIMLPELILAVLLIIPLFVITLMEIAICWVNKKIHL